MPWEDDAARRHVAHTEGMLAALDALPDTAARDHALETLHALVELYGQCLARVMAHVSRADCGGLLPALLADELVGHLLFVHGLHPEPLETRVRRALEEVRPTLTEYGGDVELLAVDETTARVRLSSTGPGSACSSVTLDGAVRDAVTRAAPEIERVAVEGGARSASAPTAAVDGLFRGSL
ncbi:NifU family protein [Streptomyces sp. NPDC003077]|uniref:NifU family protein n=1 Tax=Streptomyces sp. NPDC003077 TaxID=3154443 RepID=UPI0033BA1806